MKDGFLEKEEKNIEEQKPKKTGAKKAIIAFSIAAGLVVGAIGVKHTCDLIDNVKETNRAQSIVASYTDSDLLCTLPEEVILNKAYDAKFCDGEKLVTSLLEAGVKYCELDGTYYTPEGEPIALLTYEITRTEIQAANRYEYDGNVVYMPPAGFDMNGTQSEKDTTEQITVIVAKSPNGDYSSVKISNVTSYKLINAEEVNTLPYSAISEQTLICDVADNATLNERNECIAELRLVPKKSK